jgi:hypothetical protein
MVSVVTARQQGFFCEIAFSRGFHLHAANALSLCTNMHCGALVEDAGAQPYRCGTSPTVDLVRFVHHDFLIGSLS